MKKGLHLEAPFELLRGSFEQLYRAFDQSFFRKMGLHHQVGVDLARLAAEKAEREELRTLGRMMIAEQRAEIEVQRRRWASWFGGELPPPTPEEDAAMPGMPRPGTVERLSALGGRDFEGRFLEVMTSRDEGAIQMSNEAWARAGDLGPRLFADQVRHAQIIQAERIRRLRMLEGSHYMNP